MGLPVFTWSKPLAHGDLRVDDSGGGDGDVLVGDVVVREADAEGELGGDEGALLEQAMFMFQYS